MNIAQTRRHGKPAITAPPPDVARATKNFADAAVTDS
jgi:hypothetical protein